VIFVSRVRALGALLLAFGALLLAGCGPVATVGIAKGASVPDGHKLENGQGYIAMRIDAALGPALWGATISYVDYENASSHSSRLQEALVGPKGAVRFRNGVQYLVLPEAAGEYTWTRFDLNNGYVHLRGTNSFRVRPDTITYIGHVRFWFNRGRLQVTVQDEESDMRQHIAASFPELAKSYGFEKSLAQVYPR
jgi:hypothetical protein